MSPSHKIDLRGSTGRGVQHLLFWSASVVVLTFFFAYEPRPVWSDWVYTLLFHLSLWWAVYWNLFFLIPRWLQHGRYALYALGVLAVGLSAIWINQTTFRFWSDHLFPGYYFISYYEWRDLALFVLIYLSLTTLLKLSKAWFQLNQQRQRLREVERERLDAELSALRSQINPHFFFNSLNSLYSLSLDRDERVPAALLQLSQNMRYVLYESNTPLVELRHELAYLRNYLELQRLRVEDRVDLRLEVEGKLEEHRLAPLLFIPLVENAFKHGLRAREGRPYVHIRLEAGPQRMHFSIENSFVPPGLTDDRPAGGGIGLQNLRRRLELLYPQEGKLVLRSTDDRYCATLEIPWS